MLNLKKWELSSLSLLIFASNIQVSLTNAGRLIARIHLCRHELLSSCTLGYVLLYWRTKLKDYVRNSRLMVMVQQHLSFTVQDNVQRLMSHSGTGMLTRLVCLSKLSLLFSLVCLILVSLCLKWNKKHLLYKTPIVLLKLYKNN